MLVFRTPTFITDSKVSECEFTLNSILDDLQRDRWPVTDTLTKRPARCTGSALSVAIGLLENLYAQN